MILIDPSRDYIAIVGKKPRAANKSQLRQRIEELERLNSTLYEACEAFETLYDASVPSGYGSRLLVEARRAMDQYRELQKGTNNE